MVVIVKEREEIKEKLTWEDAAPHRGLDWFPRKLCSPRMAD